MEDIDILDADYEEEYDGDPSRSLQKELDSNYERETRLKRYKRFQEPVSEDREPMPEWSIHLLKQIQQQKDRNHHELLMIERGQKALTEDKKIGKNELIKPSTSLIQEKLESSK